MSLESELTTVLKSVCPRVFPGIAPSGTAKPYLTWQGIGGVSLRYLDNTAADKRNRFVQVNAWALTRLEADTLARQVEDVLCSSLVLVVTPESEPMDTNEEDTKLYGSIQRFSIWADR